MKKQDEYQNWAEEFRTFMNVKEAMPPHRVSTAIQQVVHNDLNPRMSGVVAKISLIHVLVGSLSLLVCSQFGMGKGTFLIHYMMSWGEVICMMACGSLFLGLTTLVAGIVLTRAELRRIRRTGYSIVLLLGLASLFVFFCFGADMSIRYALAWLIGALMAGVAGTELSLGLRTVRYT